VLLAEDDDAVAELVTQMLDELGYDSSRVPDAREALTRVQSDDPIDLVLSDMVMPGDMVGLDLARAIRQQPGAPPIILMTGYSDAAAAAMAEGFELLLKPYTLEALGTALRTATEVVAGGARGA
jgi:CheY-like chemotaxis protein